MAAAGSSRVLRPDSARLARRQKPILTCCAPGGLAHSQLQLEAEEHFLQGLNGAGGHAETRSNARGVGPSLQGRDVQAEEPVDERLEASASLPSWRGSRRCLWEHFSKPGHDPAGPSAAALQAALDKVGFRRVAFDSNRIVLGRRGMGLTLNGIAPLAPAGPARAT